MKKIRTETKALFIIPFILLFLFVFLASYVSFHSSSNQLKARMIFSGYNLTESLSQNISNNLEQKDIYIDSLNSRLISVGNFLIENRELITNEYLYNIAQTFELTDIYWYNADGLLLADANNEFVGWTPEVGDPIYNFMHSGLDQYIEEIRKSTEDDRYYKFVYLRADDNYFIQLGVNADTLYEFTQQYEYQNIVEQVVNQYPELLYALVIDTNYIAVADTDHDDIGIDYTGDSSYEQAFLGETNSVDWYYEKIGETVLEVVAPIYYDNEIIGVFAIGYSYDDYNILEKVFLYTFITQIGFMILFYVILQAFFVNKPIKEFRKSIERIDLNNINYDDSSLYQGLFRDVKSVIRNLMNSVYNRNVENEKLIGELTNFAFVDQLTQLPNRVAALQKLDELCVGDKQVAAIYFDIDGFKLINDVHGHHFGDMVIQEIAKKMTSLTIPNLYIFRYQGDEFLIIYEFSNKDELDSLIDTLKEFYQAPLSIKDIKVNIEFSIGISIYPIDGNTSHELLHKADIAMYEAKKYDKMSYVVFDSTLQKKLDRKNEVLLKLEQAILEDGFELLYQPQVNIDSNEIIGLEALLRIKDSTISPYEFIPIAEQNRLINKIGRIVLEKAIIQQAEWITNGISIVPISVNFSGNQLSDSKVVQFISALLDKHKIPSNMLGIELTESTILDNKELTIKTLTEMKLLGLKTAIDDFGSGQAGINYLTQFKVDTVKLDKSFSDEFLKYENLNVYLTVIKLAHELGFEVLAEGIELQEQIDILKTTDCKLVQGYYYYKPSKPDIIMGLLKTKET